MATPPEQPWTNRERNYLLAEILKAVDPPAENLLNLIRALHVQPRWEDIPLPAGRSLNSSRRAFDDLWRSMSSQSMVAPHTPTPLSMPAQTLKRPYSFDGLYSTGGGSAREIRPRPTQPINTSYPQPTNEPPAKKKRGRPTKAEQAAKEEAKLAAAAAAAAVTASGESASAPMSRPTTQTPGPTQLSTTSVPHPEELKPVMAAAARMPIAAMLTPTAREPKSASTSGSSSSGKRRRARSNRSEVEGGGGGGGNLYDSPYGRMASGPEDSPARTAVLRHREESLMGAPRNDPPPPPPLSGWVAAATASGSHSHHPTDPGPPPQ